MNCRAAPIARFAEVGAIEIPVSDFGTVRVAVPLTPLRVAVIVVEPGATAVAIPDALTVAKARFEEDQLTVELTFAAEPSL